MPRIPSACIVKQFWPHLQRFNIISTFALEMLDLLSNRRCTTVSASHTATLMEASQRVVILKKKRALANQSRHCGRNIRCLSHVFSSVTSLCHFPATSFSPLHFPMWICEKHLPKWTESQSVCKTPYSDGNKMSQKSMEETSLQIGPLWALIFVIHFN